MDWFCLIAASVLMLVGYVLLFLEVAVIPGFGFIGILGLGAVGGGTAMIWIEFGSLWGILSLVGSVPFFAIAARVFFRSKASGRLVLNDAITGSSSAVTGLGHLIGQDGVAVTQLRPAGHAMIAGERLDVVSEGEFVEKGAAVVVVRIDNNSLVVTRKTLEV